MKPSRSALIIAVMGVVIALLTAALLHYAGDELNLTAEHDLEIPARSAVTTEDGFSVVRLSPESQKASGIATASLVAARAEASAEVYGLVLNSVPLFEMRGRYLAAAAEIPGLRAISANNRAEFERLKKLFDDDRNVSERALLLAESQWHDSRARLAAAEQRAASLLDEIRASWGPTVGRWAGEANSSPLDALAGQRASLITMTLPHDLEIAADRSVLKVAPVSRRSSARLVRFVGASPHGDATLSGISYLYLADDPELRSGMRLAGQVRIAGKVRDGVIVPASAVVWHGGKAWVYVKEDGERFARRPLASDREMGAGWFAGDGFGPESEVVVDGAQLLLSEEFKFQIRNENED